MTNRNLKITGLIMGAVLASVSLIPHVASAAAVTLSSATATSTPAYTNTGLATTTRAKTGDTVQYQLTLSGTPLIAPQINIFLMGSTTMSGSGANWYYATTTASVWTEGAVTFRLGFGGTTGAEATTTITQTSLTGTNVTFDKTGPTLNSISWSDVDASTQFSAGDTLTLTFNETMATSTITTGNVDTTLALSGSHTFGASPTVAWNTAGTILTLTLGTSPTVATGDTVDPTTAVKDAIGNNDATAAPLTITDNVGPGNPTGLADTSFHGSIQVALASVGSSQIRYTIDGSSPNCSVGSVYSSAITFTSSVTLEAVGCDEGNNLSSVVTAVYTKTGSSGGGGGGSSHHTTDTTTTNTTTTPSSSTQAMINSILAQIQALVAQAKAQGITVTTGAAVSGDMSSDLTIGSSGGGVHSLQAYLNGHGFAVAASGPGSPGNETSLFGALTKAALSSFQASAGITPASGFFGPKTRAYILAHP